MRAAGRITLDVAREALAMLGVYEHGLDETDRNLMLTIIQKYSGSRVATALAYKHFGLDCPRVQPPLF